MADPPFISESFKFSRDHWARLRILDANANRAAEGLRVVEEYARFVLEDAPLAMVLKQTRHDLTAALNCLPLGDRLAARDTPGDVGTRIETAQERQRPTVEDVVGANLERVEQALRCLEEYSKGYQPTLALAAEQIRYQVYPLAQALLRGATGRHRLAHARLYVLVEGLSSTADFERLCGALVAAGVHILQLRDKHLDDRELLDRARRLRQLTRSSSTLFIMNDRPDLAVLAEADGVHVGQDELAVADARRIVGPRALIGVSTHTVEQVRKAVIDGADYIGCGPTFPSATKSFAEFAGLEFLRAANEQLSIPAFAIGGIHAGNLDAVLETGTRRIAVSAAVTRADDPALAARQLLERLESPIP